MWILFSLLSAFLWSVVNIIDKTIITKFVRRPIIPVIITGLLGFVASLIILLKNFVLISTNLLMLSMLAGIFYMVATIFYFKALQIEETSRVIPLFALTVVWVAVIAAIFLQEILSLKEYFGIFLVFIGSFLISSRRKIKINLSKALILMASSTFLYAAHNVLIKALLNFSDYWNIFAYSRIGIFLSIIPILIYLWPSIKEMVKKFRGRASGLMASSESLSLAGDLLFMVAASLGFISLVTTVSTSLQYVFIFLLTVIISIWRPKIIREELKSSTILLKLISIVIIISGIALIT